MELAWAIGAGLGLSALAGFRVFIPVAVFMLLARMEWVWGYTVTDTPLDFFQSGIAIIVLAVLVVLEVLMTRLPALVRIEQLLRLPLAIAAGALLMTAAVSGETSYYLVGLPVGIALSVLGLYVHRGMIVVGEGRDPGPVMDLSVLILSVLFMLVPPAGYAMLLLLIWLAWRVRKLKRLKYKGLRVLA